MSISSFFKKIGHGINQAAHEVAHDLESGVKGVVKGVEGVVEHGADAIGDVLHGDFRDALKQMGKAGESVADTVKAEAKLALTAGTAMTDLALGSVADAHLSKGLTKLANSAKGVVDKTRDGVDQAVNQFVDSGEGVVAGSVRCADDLAHGRLDRLGKDGLSVAGNAFNVCTSLTPEGMVANVGANVAGSLLHGTALSKFGDIAGDALARKPTWMLRDGFQDVAGPLVDPLLQKGIASDRTTIGTSSSFCVSNDPYMSPLQVGGGMQAGGTSPLLFSALGDAPSVGGATYSALTGADDDSNQKSHDALETLVGRPAFAASGGVSTQLRTV